MGPGPQGWPRSCLALASSVTAANRGGPRSTHDSHLVARQLLLHHVVPVLYGLLQPPEPRVGEELGQRVRRCSCCGYWVGEGNGIKGNKQREKDLVQAYNDSALSAESMIHPVFCLWI